MDLPGQTGEQCPAIKAGIVAEKQMIFSHLSPVDVPGHHVDHQPVSEADGVENHLKVRLGLLLLHVVSLLAGQGPSRPVPVLHRRQHPLQQVPVPSREADLPIVRFGAMCRLS